MPTPLPGLPERRPQADGSRTSRPQVRLPEQTGLLPCTGVEGAPGGQPGLGPLCGLRGCCRAAAGVSPGQACFVFLAPSGSTQPLPCVPLPFRFCPACCGAARARLSRCSHSLQSACYTRVPCLPHVAETELRDVKPLAQGHTAPGALVQVRGAGVPPWNTSWTMAGTSQV